MRDQAGIRFSLGDNRDTERATPAINCLRGEPSREKAVEVVGSKIVDPQRAMKQSKSLQLA
jgi:hypothetical protein